MFNQGQRLCQTVHRYEFRTRGFSFFAVVAGQGLRGFDAFYVVDGFDVAVVTRNQNRTAPAVRFGFVECRLAFGAGQTDLVCHHVETSRLQTRHHRIPLRFFKFDFDAQFVGNGAGNFHIVAGQLAVFVVVGKRRVSAFGADGNRTFIVDALD